MCPKHLQKKKPRMWMGLSTDSNWIKFSLIMLIKIHGPLMTIHRSGVCYISTWYTELTKLHC